ncbi:phosphate ABC transporter, permease protein PstA [Tenericutes bacterium MO-XQ]|nr:phosphate ABC transporter, permease protein PstA [Tenericutes bacterium MO-XQ]AUD63671.1 phosphate ABC transporter, permease protein PstA [Tenericutes bacterium MO-XQ]
MSMLSRRQRENLYKGITYGASFISLAVLLLIVGYVFLNGFRLLNLDLITHNYKAVTYIADIDEGFELGNFDTDRNFDEDTFYSEKWGLALTNDEDLQGKNVIVVTYVHPDSPLHTLNNKGVGDPNLDLRIDYEIIRIAFDGAASALSSRGAQNMITLLDQQDDIRELEFATTGGGIRGSIITTFYLIVLTLVFALPIGIGAAIYLNEYAKNNKFNRMLRSFIETLTGVPSIIYGLMGLAIFVPITIRLTSATTGNLISGSMTLAVILLPIIIRTTEESLKVVPDDYRFASLALGASKTQTVFKVILPNAFTGILTATLLAIGRIIGESAALVFAIGTSIKDDVYLTDRSTSLAVHIWSMMTDEPANIELSSTIALIILMIVLILNISIKLISKRFMRKYGVVR